MNTRTARDERINLRASSSKTATTRKAAEATETTMTEFIMSSATRAAEQVLTDRRWFVLSDAEWEDFQAVLDRPAEFKPRLAALLTVEDPFID